MNNDEHTTLLREAARHLRSATGIHDYPVAVAMDTSAPHWQQWVDMGERR